MRSHTLGPALGQLAAAAVGLAAVEIVVMYSGVPATPPWQVLLLPMLGLLYLAAGLVAWWRRPSNRMGALLCAGGLAWIAAGLYNVSQGPLVAVGLMSATLGLAIVVHLLHAFPSGRLRGRWSIATVATGYAVCIVLQAPLYLFSPGPLELTDRADLARAGQWVQDGVGALVMIATAVILAQRLAGLGRAQRRVVGPLYAYGILAVLLVPVSAQLPWLFPFGPLTVFEVQIAAVAGVAVAFVLAMLLGGFARTVELQELGAWLGSRDDEQPTLQAALADALGDPSLTLAFWIEDTGTYADAAGREVRLPAAGDQRAAVEVELRGERIGAIEYDGGLLPDPGLVRSAGRIVALAVERERLTAALRASDQRLRASRARIAQAADQERRRIARDLHDGLQTRLVVLAIRADSVRAKARGDARAEAAELHAGLQSAIVALRELVHGVMPAALSEGGLYGAVRELAEQVPLPTRLELDQAGPTLSPPTETAGYFLVSEAVTNAVKHSHAHELQLRIARSDARLRIEVADDGVGGASQDAGGGLRGIADRIEALDGRVWLESPAGGGTRLVAELPCAS
jgi:signal transduction histidine kinase